ncbi:hypothetical protein JD276_14025 [Leucobacter sp. CSA1]|uniref:Uncharacterized protein n=1 Tax=Leucobacter chromiisoli TaxID=2796471 RepID=A0A934QAG5_9MICO|nr:hypothetical protein [Leucobacter chromiisoli]MBK0420151.1 hypothetical protein [Leucobacter chromiisoli]
MADLTGPRRPSWRVDLLDRDYAPLGEIDGVTGGSIELVALSRLGASGSLTILDRGQDIDWMSHRVRLTYDPGIPGIEAWPVATMLFTSPTTRTRSGVRSFDAKLLSPLAVVDEDTTEATYSLPAGTPIIPTVVALIQSTGETRIAATESEAVLRSPMVWEAGTPKLTIINELLESAGYWSLWCDGSGQHRVEPYVPPADREPAYTFQAGAVSIHSPDWSREQDHAAVPNRFIVIGEGSDEEPAIVGVATNENPDSPYSFQARGRWITETEEGAEVADQVAADLLAQRRLLDRMSPVAKLSVSHSVMPLDPNDVVTFQPRGHSTRATVQRMSFQLSYDSLCQAEWREAQ